MNTSYPSLSTQEALLRAQTYGKNELAIKKTHTTLSLLLSQFTSLFIVILLIAAALSFSFGDMIDSVCILAIVVLNGGIGFFQEYKAEKAVAELTKQSIFYTRVIRDNTEQEIDSRFLVPGDIILLEAGNKVPADSIVLEATSLQVDEAVLTGESLPVSKTVDNPKLNQLFMGTTIVKGHGVAKVTSIGLATQFGHLTTSLASVQKVPTRLETYITDLGKKLSLIGISCGALLFILSILHNQSFFSATLTSISLIVAAVPEGLPAIITIALATGAMRMTKKHVIIRKMAAIETLGEVSLIATDKTGTLTQNKMAVKNIWVDNVTYAFHDQEKLAKNSAFQTLLLTSVLCNNAHLVEKKDQPVGILGDQTEAALLLLAKNHHLIFSDITKEYSRKEEFTFDDTRKMMTTVYEHHGTFTAYTKGAPEVILDHASCVLLNGEQIPLTEEIRFQIHTDYQAYAKEGLRVLGFGYKTLTPHEQPFTQNETETDLVFVGFVGIADPIRDDVAQSIDKTQKAGIQTIMITGDNEHTASSIGKEIGLPISQDTVITGKILETLSERDLIARIQSTTPLRIYARCSPEHKLRIVKAYQQLGYIVAATGDGVNDTPCLKQANVGIAMGKTGTDVTREVADIIITDDNYASIAAGIEEGRLIFDNILTSMRYLLISNLSEIITILFSVAIGLPAPFLPIHILWINIVTDSFPAIALALDTKKHSLMTKPESMRHLHFFSTRKLFDLSIIAAGIGGITIVIYAISLSYFSLEASRTIAFNLLILLEMLLAFFMNPKQKWHTNPLLILAVLFTFLSQLAIFLVPFLRVLFQVGL